MKKRPSFKHGRTLTKMVLLNMFPPLVLTRSGSKGHYLMDNLSTGNTGSPIFYTISYHHSYYKCNLAFILLKCIIHNYFSSAVTNIFLPTKLKEAAPSWGGLRFQETNECFKRQQTLKTAKLQFH